MSEEYRIESPWPHRAHTHTRRSHIRENHCQRSFSTIFVYKQRSQLHTNQHATHEYTDRGTHTHSCGQVRFVARTQQIGEILGPARKGRLDGVATNRIRYIIRNACVVHFACWPDNRDCCACNDP